MRDFPSLPEILSWPKDSSGRRICSALMPMPQRRAVDPYNETYKETKAYWVHPDAVDDGECSSGCCQDYRCPHCGIRWREELPD